MEENDLHDLSDDADYAASQQQVNVNLLRNSSLKRSSSSELDGAEIIYSKDNVAIHPIQYDTERISGRLKLIMQGSSLFLTWIPYKELTPNQRLNEIDRNLYTIREVPFKDIRSIRRHTPTLGWQYVIVVLSSGLAYPPLYFYSGGVKEFLATIKQHIFLVRSAEDANVFLVNDLLHPLQRTISSLELPGPVSVANGLSSPRSVVGPFSNEIHERDGIASQIKQNGRQIHKSQDPARDISINVLEKFSMVTKFARDTTSHLFREYHGDGMGAREWRDHSPSFGDFPHHDTSTQETPESSDPPEFDKWKLIPGQPRLPPLGSEEWSGFLDSEGRIVDPEALRKRIFYGGVDCKLRSEVWPFLLGYHSYDSTYTERESLISLKKSQYETIKNQWQSISYEQAKRFTKYRERKGLIEKDVVRTDRALSFYDGDDNPNINRLHDILLTYSFYNFDLGYCQGMSDLLSPILVIVQDDSEAFWCFVALMERLGPNFNRDQNGMHSQLFALSKVVELLDGPLHNYFTRKDCLNYFFCFRWLLIQFKREFEFESTMLLWEVMWTHYLSEHIHLYVCVAILKRHRQKIMEEQMDFDTLLKFINDLSGNIDLDSTLSDAEALCIYAGEDGAALIPPGTPPSLPIKDVSFYNQEDQNEVL